MPFYIHIGKVADVVFTSINFDFTTGSLPAGVTFTRSTKGWYFNSSGTFTEAAIDAPRFEYNPATLAGPYLLYEPQRTNYLVQSDNLATSWGTSGAPTISAGGGATSPDGTASDRLTATSTGACSVWQNLTLPSDGDYTLSRAVKAGTTPYMANRTAGFGGDKTAWFELATGTFGTVQSPATAAVRSLGNGWFDTSLTVAIATDLSGQPFYYQPPTDGAYNTIVGSYLDIWIAQIELGSKSTSYIPTTTAAVTRSADALSFTIGGSISTLTYTFDDDSTQAVSVSAGSYTVPNTFNRWGIKSIVGS